MPLYITEYRRFGRDDRGAVVPAGQEPAITTQVKTIGAAILSDPLDKNCRVVELHCDAVCHVKFSTVKESTGATTSHKRLPSGATQFFTVPPGLILSVIAGA